MLLDPWNFEKLDLLGSAYWDTECKWDTSVEIASHLVGYAYMDLVGVNDKVPRTCFMPDPVCARLAMCLMDENWEDEAQGPVTI